MAWLLMLVVGYFFSSPVLHIARPKMPNIVAVAQDDFLKFSLSLDSPWLFLFFFELRPTAQLIIVIFTIFTILVFKWQPVSFPCICIVDAVFIFLRHLTTAAQWCHAKQQQTAHLCDTALHTLFWFLRFLWCWMMPCDWLLFCCEKCLETRLESFLLRSATLQQYLIF